MNIALTLRQKEIATGLSIIVVVLLGFGLGEGAIRLAQLSKFGVETTVEKSSMYQRDEETGLRVPVPNASRGAISFNSLGFRSPEIAVPKPPHTIRLAFLGSSTTFDANQRLDRTWPDLTARLLADRVQGCDVDYVNAGVPGFTLKSMDTYFGQRVVPVEPDVVVILPGGFSVEADRLAVEKGISDGNHFQSSWLADVSALWAKVEKNIQVIRLQRSAHLSAGKLQFDEEEFSSSFRAELDELVGHVQAVAGVTVLSTMSSQLRWDQPPDDQLHAANTALFFAPYMSIEGLLKARDFHNNAIRSVASRHDLVLVADNDETPPTPEFFVDSVHFTAAGSKLMAQRVSSQIAASSDFNEFLRLRRPECSVAPR